MFKSQSAMEYLMTYGWAILIIAVVLAVLYQLGVFGSTNVIGNACLAQVGFTCQHLQLGSSGTLDFSLGYIGNGGITITGVGCSNNSSVPTSFPGVGNTLQSGSVYNTSVTCALSSNSLGTPFSGTIWIEYTQGTETGLEQQVAVVRTAVSFISSPPQPLSFSVIANVPVGSYPFYGIYDPSNGDYFVANSRSGTVSQISGSTLVNTITVDTSYSQAMPYTLAYDPGNDYVWAVNEGSQNGTGISNVTAITSSGTYVGRVPVWAVYFQGSAPQWAVYDPQNGYMYVPNGAGGGYGADLVISGCCTGSAIVNSIYTSYSAQPTFPIYDPGNGYIYVLNLAGTVDVISGTSFIATGITVGSAPMFGVYDSGNGDVYVMNWNTGTVSVISGTSVVNTITVGSIPGYGTYDPGNGYIYVPNVGAGTVSVISGTSVVNTITVGSDPNQATYDSGNGYIYVPNVLSGTVSVISGTSVVNTITVQQYPCSATYDPQNGYVYVPNYGSDTVSIIKTTGG